MSRIEVNDGAAAGIGTFAPLVSAGAVFSIAGTLSISTGTHRYYPATAGTVGTLARASVGTAPTGASVIVVVKKNGVTAVTLTIPAGSNTATAVPSVTLTTSDYLTVDVTQVGSGTPGSDLVVSLV